MNAARIDPECQKEQMGLVKSLWRSRQDWSRVSGGALDWSRVSGGAGKISQGCLEEQMGLRLVKTIYGSSWD